MKAVWFCEDDFADSTDIANEDEFDAFERGFGAGASEYGGGKWRVYLLPRDHDKMAEEEHVGEVMRAIEHIGSVQHPETT